MADTHSSTSLTRANAGASGRTLGIALLVGALVLFVAYTAWREARKSPAPAVTAAVNSGVGHGMGEVERPPMSADEERYAHSLWKVHDQVRTSAVKMTFAGMSYKLGDIDKVAMRGKVTPLIEVFQQAHAQVSELKAPAKLRTLHGDYLEALSLYREASREMSKSTRAGDDAHLLTAHDMATKASTLLLKVGDALWPGEYKPN